MLYPDTDKCSPLLDGKVTPSQKEGGPALLAGTPEDHSAGRADALDIHMQVHRIGDHARIGIHAEVAALDGGGGFRS